MADALKHLHAKRIVHRDLKTANCFLSEDGSIKIGDLNVSKAMKNGLLQTQVGVSSFLHPRWGSLLAFIFYYHFYRTLIADWHPILHEP